MKRYLAATQQSMATLLPVVLALTWLALGQRLVLLPDGFFRRCYITQNSWASL